MQWTLFWILIFSEFKIWGVNVLQGMHHLSWNAHGTAKLQYNLQEKNIISQTFLLNLFFFGGILPE